MRHNNCTFAGGLERGDDMKQISIVAVLDGRHAVSKAVELVVGRIKPGSPGLVRERWIGYDKIKSL